MTITVLPRRDELGVKPGRLLIDGQWREADDQWTHVHPASGEEVTTVPVASATDVDDAVRAARRAFDEGPWPRARARERMLVLRRVADLVRERRDELTTLLALDNGTPVSAGTIAYPISLDVVADIFDHNAGWVDKIAGETLPAFQGGEKLMMTLREPVGVVGSVIAWNAPGLLFANKVAPALAAGCTVVLKPSEYASLLALRLAEILVEAGVPEGVLNVVTGPADPTGEALITHPGVDKISFTGSRAVGTRIMEAAAPRITRVGLELGGKSPLVVFPDAPSVDMAAATAMGNVTLTLSGQGCICLTRALVHRDVYDQFLATAERITGIVAYGDPFDSATNAGPIINGRQMDRILGLIDKGTSEGARLVCGGERADGDLAQGNYIRPTLLADVDNTSTIAQTEVFGPVLAVIPFADEDEALRLANDTEYGLGGLVYTSDVQRALRAAKAIRAGTVTVNGFMVEPHVPFGGFKASGIGREGGRAAIDAYTELKTVLIPFTDERA
jgi:aldehyde dehydrogenase (NAD+)